VYKEFTCTYKSSTAFYVRPDPSKANYYLVKHTRQSTGFSWLYHDFWVKDVVNEEMLEESELNCECMRIEHIDNLVIVILFLFAWRHKKLCFPHFSFPI
jgi:hypothetical protein